MAIINLAEKGIAGQIRGRIGQFGDPDPLDVLGIYQIRTRYGKQVQVKEVFYTPTNPQTEAQQAWRAVFSAGVSAWQALGEEAKDVYRDLAKYFNLTGFNLFMAEYLNEHK